jgi:chromosome segregation ATPase
MSGVKMVFVALLASTYRYGEPAVSYGPSQGPIEIPEGLAHGLGLEIIDAPEGLEEATPSGETIDANLLTQVDFLEKELGEAKLEAKNRTLDLSERDSELETVKQKMLDLESQVGSLKFSNEQQAEVISTGSSANKDQYAKIIDLEGKLETASKQAARVSELEKELGEARKEIDKLKKNQK